MLRLSIRELFPNPAEAFWCDAKVGGNLVLGDSLFEGGVAFMEFQVALFGRFRNPKTPPAVSKIDANKFLPQQHLRSLFSHQCTDSHAHAAEADGRHHVG